MNQNYCLRELTLDEMSAVYDTYMTADFPKNELRPFSSVVQLHGEGRYTGYGMYDQADQLQAYVFLAMLREDTRCHYLVDYLAVLPDRRDSGLGSVLLRLLPEALKNAGCIVGEVEDPDRTEDPREKHTRQRRIAFYQRAGYLDTGVKVCLFGVDYRVMEIPSPAGHSPGEIRRVYEAIYRSFLPEHIFLEKVQLRIP